MCVCHNRTSEKIYPVVERVIGSAECNSDIGQGYLFLPHFLSLSLSLSLSHITSTHSECVVVTSELLPFSYCVYMTPFSLSFLALSFTAFSYSCTLFLNPFCFPCSYFFSPSPLPPPLFPLPPYFLTPSPAISYECIKTVATIYPNNSVVSTTAKCLSRFVTSTNNDWRYLGINGLASLVQVMYLHKKCCHFIQSHFSLYIVMLLDNVLKYVRAENSCRSR